MEALASVVFERTPKGAVAMKSSTDDVPRRLRTLLLAIDGRSPVGQYVLLLSAFAPLSEKFAELENMGFIRRSSGVAADSAAPTSTPPTSTPRVFTPSVSTSPTSTTSNSNLPESGFMPAKESDLQALAAAPGNMQATFAINAFERELQVLANQMSLNAAAPALPLGSLLPSGLQGSIGAGTGTGTGTSLEAQIRPNAEKLVLADLLREMDRFVQQYAGADALPISLMLEQIKTLAQLRSELPQYVELVRRYGPSAEPHIQRLATLLSKA